LRGSHPRRASWKYTKHPAQNPTTAFSSASAAIHTAYFVLLDRGYRHGDLSVVYPLARATGPILTIVAAIAFLGERPGPVVELLRPWIEDGHAGDVRRHEVRRALDAVEVEVE
jgi:hypothetical protein